MDIRSSIAETRKEFEKSFATGDFYNKQTQDPPYDKLDGAICMAKMLD